MAYICNDCSNQSTKRFPSGKCPACDSYNISSTNKLPETTTKTKKPKTLIEIVILVLLWGLIAYGGWSKYYRHDQPAKPKAVATATKAEDPVLGY
jgi:hypothetical protein